VVTLYVALYGLGLNLPYVLVTGNVIYGILTWDSVTSWIMGFALLFAAPILYFICYGLIMLK
jgi:hypothetical protein